MPVTPYNTNYDSDRERGISPLESANSGDVATLEADAPGISVEVEYGNRKSARKGRGQRSTDLVRIYLQEIGRVPLLGRDEEVALAQKVQRYMTVVERRQEMAEAEGAEPSLESWAEAVDIPAERLRHLQRVGERAKDHMIKANLRLVVSVAKKYQNRGLELLDLIQEGTLGLERAVEKFDPTKGYRFSTYAYWWIRQGITRAIATQSRTIRLPVHITEKLNKIKKAQRKISQERGRTATIEDIARELDLTAPAVRDLLVRVPRSVSLETKVGKDKDTELGDLLESEDMSPEDLATRDALSRDLSSLLAELTTREQEVIRLRFGLEDGRTHSLAEIGRTLELSRERVRQIESKALQKLRQPKRRNLVRDYLEAL